MSEQTSERLFAATRAASERFDYYLTGGTAALAAYIGQNLKPSRLGWSLDGLPQTLELVALGLLVLSVFCGLRQIESSISLSRSNYRQVYSNEFRQLVVAAKKARQPVLLRPDEAIRRTPH
jgi:hypothetical protein